jgi:hypothetical protein
MMRTCTRSQTALWAAAALALLAGCSTAPPERVQTRVPVPVACHEAVPERPVMPTDALAPGVAPWTLLRAALAEIDRREGYEVQMRAALVACTTEP